MLALQLLRAAPLNFDLELPFKSTLYTLIRCTKYDFLYRFSQNSTLRLLRRYLIRSDSSPPGDFDRVPVSSVKKLITSEIADRRGIPGANVVFSISNFPYDVAMLPKRRPFDRLPVAAAAPPAARSLGVAGVSRVVSSPCPLPTALDSTRLSSPLPNTRCSSTSFEFYSSEESLNYS